MDALLHSGPRWSEMPGDASGVSGLMDEFDPQRMLTTYSAHVVHTTKWNTSSVCVTVVISDDDTYLEYLPTGS